MRHTTTWLLTACILLISGVPTVSQSPAAPQNPSDEQAVRATIDKYFRGMATGDATLLREAYTPDARIQQANAKGVVTSRTGEEFAASASGRPYPADMRVEHRIIRVEILGTAAIVRAELDYPQLVFTDFLSLLKIDGTWRIVHKVFDRVMKAPAPR